MQKMKIAAIVLSIVLAIGLGAAFVIGHNREQAQLQLGMELEAALEPLYKRLHSLEEMRQSLDDSYAGQVNGTGTLGLVYLGASLELYESVYPSMTEHGYRGVVALSADSFPGDEDCMSLAQLQEMLAEGWAWCMVFPAESASPEEDAAALLARAADAGLADTSTVYFPAGLYTPAYDTWLAGRGFDTVIQHGESEHETVALESGGEMWFPMSLDWHSNLRKHYISDARESYRDRLVEVNLAPYTPSRNEAYHDSMLNAFDRYSANAELQIMMPAEARQYRLAIEARREQVSDTWQSKRDRISAQIKEIQAEIDELYQSLNQIDE